jgi:deazaflavin-dependent oxidoreductase (nitroreductase family)
MSSSTTTPTRRPWSSRRPPRSFRWLNPIAIWIIERLGIGRNNGVLYHSGRRTGREYATPLCMVSTPDGYIVPAAFGPHTDWLLNLKATPSSHVVVDRRVHETVAEVITLEQAIDHCGGTPGCRCWLSGIDEFVLLRPAPEPEDEARGSTDGRA